MLTYLYYRMPLCAYACNSQKLLGSEFWQDEETKAKVALTTNSGVHCSVIPPYVIAIVTNLFLGLYKNFESHLVRHTWERQNGFYMRELAGSTFGICEWKTLLVTVRYGMRNSN